jgi:hypothetical protein
LVSHIKKRTYTDGDGRHGAEENIWASEVEVIGDWRKIHN